MFVSSCPRCSSDRVRRGYRRTPWWSAIIGRYNLHCVDCNWEFVGFALPGFVSQDLPKKRRKTKKQNLQEQKLSVQDSEVSPSLEEPSTSLSNEPSAFAIEGLAELPESDQTVVSESDSLMNENDEFVNLATPKPKSGKTSKRKRVRTKR